MRFTLFTRIKSHFFDGLRLEGKLARLLAAGVIWRCLAALAWYTSDIYIYE